MFMLTVIAHSQNKMKMKQAFGCLIPEWQRSRKPTTHSSFAALLEEMLTALRVSRGATPPCGRDR